jgi:hypothetical protein
MKIYKLNNIINKSHIGGNKQENIEIFKNDICKFTVLNNYHLIQNDKKINVICSVFFKAKNYQKNFLIYVLGLKDLIKFIDESDTDFKFILFIDINVKNDNEIMNIVNNSKKTIPILFTCSEYMNENYHIDLFGTMVRFFPFFNFENNFTNRVIIVDIELSNYHLKLLKYIINLKHENIILLSFNFWQFFYEHKQKKLTFPHLVAGLISTSDKYDKNILTKFINNAHKIKSTGHYRKRLTTWGYGIDELFLNDIFVKNKIFLIFKEYQISHILRKSKKYLMDNSRIKNSEKILKLIIDNVKEQTKDIIPDKKLNIDEMINIIDKYTFGIKKRTYINDIISINFYKAITQSLKTNNMFLGINVMIFVSKYLMNIISCKMIVTYDNDQIKKIDYYDIVYDSTQDEL